MPLDENQAVPLVEGVVAERHRIGAGIQELLQDGLGDAEAAGGVLAVDDDEIELIARYQLRQAFDDRIAAGASDDVAEKEKTHSDPALVRCGRGSGLRA